MNTVELALAVVLVVALGSCSAAYQLGTTSEVTFTVESKERVTTGSGDSQSSKYLVFTDKAGMRLKD